MVAGSNPDAPGKGKMACARELRTGLLLLLCCFAPPDLYAGETAIRHSTYEEFIQGSLGDGGARTYISRRGRVQLIPRWDLNRDGYLDVVFNQDHNPVENVDAFIYWGSAEGYRSLFPPFWKEVLPTYKLFKSLVENRRHISFLPTFGGGPVRVADLNRDGYPDIVFPNTIHNYTVHMEIYIYWGGPHGYSVVRRQSLPTLFGESWRWRTSTVTAGRTSWWPTMARRAGIAKVIACTGSRMSTGGLPTGTQPSGARPSPP